MRPTPLTAAPADPARALGAFVGIGYANLPWQVRYGVVGRNRYGASTLVRWHRAHRSVGLTTALGMIALELEAAALEWERGTSALASSVWKSHASLHERATETVNRLMLEAAVEADRTDRDPAPIRIRLKEIADRIEWVVRDLTSYPRSDDSGSGQLLAQGLDSYEALVAAL